MRFLVLALSAALAFALPAAAQTRGPAPACEFEPTRACVLALMRAAASATAPRGDEMNRLRGSVVHLAALAGDIETATAIRDLTSGIARLTADIALARAHALAGRVEEVLRLAAADPESAFAYGRFLAVATAAAGRDGELDALLARLPGPVPAHEAVVGRIIADLARARPAAAIARLEAAPADMQGRAASIAANDLVDAEAVHLVEPLLRFVEPQERIVFAAFVAAARGDAAAARNLRREAESNAERANLIGTPIIEALSRGGAADEALALAQTARAPFPRIRRLGLVARLTRSAEAMDALEKAVAAARGLPEATAAEAERVRALAGAGRAAEAERLISAHAGRARTEMLTALIEGLALGGRADRAVIYARGLPDPVAVGYALVAVYGALPR